MSTASTMKLFVLGALIKKCERKVTRFLRKHKKVLIALSDELYQKKNLKSFEVLGIINQFGGVSA